MCTTICNRPKAMTRTAVTALSVKDIAHDQPERNGRQDDRQDEARHVGLERAVAGHDRP